MSDAGDLMELLPAHSLLGASGMSRWMACPGSFRLSKTAPSRTSIYAATGTVAHTIIEDALSSHDMRHDYVRVNDSPLGHTVDVDGHTVTIDREMLDGVNVMLDYIGDAAKNYERIFSEMTVSLDKLLEERGHKPPVALFGRTDVVLISLTDGMLEIVDYKNGAGVVVSPKNNPQELYYAAGVLSMLEDACGVDQPLPIRDVKLTIVQPNVRDLEKVRSDVVPVVDVYLWLDDVLIPAVEACAQPDAPLVPGSYCRFCPAAASCPALTEAATQMAKQEWGTPPATDLLTPERVGAALEIAERAEIFISAVRAYATDLLKAKAGVIPGWGLEPTRPTRQWANETTVLQLVRTLGLKDHDVTQTKIFSPAQMEKLVRKLPGGEPAWKALAKAQVISVSSGVKLARTDKSAADAADDFA